MFPRLFSIGSFSLPTYGLLLASAFLLAIWWSSFKAARRGLPAEQIADLGIAALFAGLVGSKLVLFLLSPGDYLSARGLIRLLQAGGVFYGGLISATIVGIVFIRRRRLPLWATIDLVAPAIALGEAVGRLGCFAAGCCWGKPTDVAWAVVFSDPFTHETIGTPLGVLLHPTQLYLSLDALILFGLLEILDRHRSFDGQIFWTYVLLHSIQRSVVELFRGDLARGFLIPDAVSTSQAIAAGTATLAVVMLVILRRRSRARQNPAG